MSNKHVWHAIDRLASLVTLLGAKASLKVSTGHVDARFYVYKDEDGNEQRIPIVPGELTITLPDGTKQFVKELDDTHIVEGSDSDSDGDRTEESSGREEDEEGEEEDEEGEEGDDSDG